MVTVAAVAPLVLIFPLTFIVPLFEKDPELETIILCAVVSKKIKTIARKIPTPLPRNRQYLKRFIKVLLLFMIFDIL
jgi:hypothetical protein